MKKFTAALLAALMLTGCGSKNTEPTIATESVSVTVMTEPASLNEAAAMPYHSRFDAETRIHLSDDSILISPPEGHIGDAPATVTHDIIYYEDKETYDSGNPYGEGTAEERHSAEEAAAHTVVNITKSGAYRVTGALSQGQIRVDLGKDAEDNPDAVVELILEDADITCTVAPAILFLNVYECDADASEETATAEVETTAAGANLILEGSNTVSGSHVAKIFKDSDEEKKLWKQDGAIYSYQSLNVFGPGSLELNADNEGLDTELHLTINGGNIRIYSGNDGINTNEDGVSVTTINGGNLTIFAGLGEEGDGIDSNGYLVINGGSVVSAANPKADAGLDSDLGSFINGGTVIAMGSAMDWAESDSDQVTMNLQFASRQQAGAKITIAKEDGTEIFSFDSDSEYARYFSGLILSHPGFTLGATYHVYVDGVQMAYTGTDVRRGPGGFGGRPGGFDPENLPEDFAPGQLPEGFDPSHVGKGRGQRSEGDREKMAPPEDFDGQRPEDTELPEGFEIPEDFDPSQFGSRKEEPGKARTDFYMNDKVNAFSGVSTAA